MRVPRAGAVIYYDDQLAGFGIRISEGGTKSYVLTHGPRRRRETIGRVGVINLKDARKEAKRLLAEYTLGKHQPLPKSWRSAVAEYLGEVRLRLRPATYESYKRHLNRQFRFGDTRMSQIAPHDLHRDLDRLRDRPGEFHHAFCALRAFVRWAHRRHYFDRNRMERMTVRRHFWPTPHSFFPSAARAGERAGARRLESSRSWRLITPSA